MKKVILRMHNDAGLPGPYKPISEGNRTDGLSRILNEKIELIRKLSFSSTLIV